MIGFIKYKLFKWLWKDICKKLDCDGCPLHCSEGFGQCEDCGEWSIDCYEIESLVYKAGRKAWKVE